MNHSIRSLFVTAALLLSSSTACGAEEPLRMLWGIDRPYFYSEVKATENFDHGGYVKKPTDRKYRFFTVGLNDAIYASQMQPLAMRVSEARDKYRKENPGRSQDDFLAHLRTFDSYVVARFKELAPVMYFDFLGTSKSEYVLQAIDVTTYSFQEYMGGGFSDKEAWYDIILSTKPGTKHYSVKSKLRFQGSGRAELRLLSGNFSNMAIQPMGRYMIRIKFIFLIDGKPFEIQTEPFLIDA